MAIRLVPRALPEVDVGPPPSGLGADVHLDIAVLGLHEPVADDVRDRQGVVHGRAAPAVHALVVAVVEVVQGRHEATDAPGAAELVDLVRVEKGLVGDVEPDHRDVDSTREDAVRGFRIRPDVELRRGRDVALGDGAAHQDDAGDALPDAGVAGEEEGNIGQRPHGDEDDAVALLEGRSDEVDRVPCGGPDLRGRQVGPVEAGLAVDMGCRPLLTDERPVAADVHRDVGAVDVLEDLERVGGRLLEGLVARDRGDTEHLHLGRGEREQERDGVVVAGIGVEDDGRSHQPLSISSISAVVGREGCAPTREAASAPAAQERRRASFRSRPSRSETTMQAVKASPAPVPSTASTFGGAARAISWPSSRSTAPSAPSVSAVRRGASGSASSSWRLTTTRSARPSTSTGTGLDGAAFSAKKPLVTRAAAATVSRGISSWQRTFSTEPGASTSLLAPGATTICVSPAEST